MNFYLNVIKFYISQMARKLILFVPWLLDAISYDNHVYMLRFVLCPNLMMNISYLFGLQAGLCNLQATFSLTENGRRIRELYPDVSKYLNMLTIMLRLVVILKSCIHPCFYTDIQSVCFQVPWIIHINTLFKL